MIFQIILFKRKFQELFLFPHKKTNILRGGGNSQIKVPKNFSANRRKVSLKSLKFLVQNYYFFFNYRLKMNLKVNNKILLVSLGVMTLAVFYLLWANKQLRTQLKSIQSSQPSVTKRTEDMTEEILKEMNMPNFPEPAAEPEQEIVEDAEDLAEGEEPLYTVEEEVSQELKEEINNLDLEQEIQDVIDGEILEQSPETTRENPEFTVLNTSTDEPAELSFEEPAELSVAELGADEIEIHEVSPDNGMLVEEEMDDPQFEETIDKLMSEDPNNVELNQAYLEKKTLKELKYLAKPFKITLKNKKKQDLIDEILALSQ